MFSQNILKINTIIKFNLFKPRQKEHIDYQPSAPPYYEQIVLIKMTKAWCVGRRHHSNTNNTTQYEKMNPRTKKLVNLLEVLVASENETNHKFLLSKWLKEKIFLKMLNALTDIGQLWVIQRDVI